MSKLWLIVLGVVAAAVVAVGVYLNFGGDDPTVPPVAAAGGSGVLSVEVGPDEHVLGDLAAPVTIIEYASLTCPHCARFHSEVLPEVKARLLDTGKARLVYRDFPLDQVALRAAALVRCAPAAQRTALLDLLFQTQQTWAGSGDPVGALDRVGRSVGMSSETVSQCLNDPKVLDAVIAQRLEGEQKYQVNATPSFVIGGRLYSGGLTADQIADLVEALTP